MTDEGQGAVRKRAEDTMQEVREEDLSHEYVEVCQDILGHQAAQNSQGRPEELWEMNRLKWVAFQHNQRAEKTCVRCGRPSRLREAEDVPGFCEPTPKGIADHPLEMLSLHLPVFDSVLAKVDEYAMLSKRWFWMMQCHLHQESFIQLVACTERTLRF
ncbi:hypothetical protein F442_22061 [Phytophthora nicotianae P10297]|uniref:Uncharacterized protein n=1 Tax=Phytophthora nicotianae P10297 TaxID=1317064 RepID=W2Y112_PHYNI|nr:hypothetical protein F442_22061 [Phytophthora nicotianae P10297]